MNLMNFIINISQSTLKRGGIIFVLLLSITNLFSQTCPPSSPANLISEWSFESCPVEQGAFNLNNGAFNEGCVPDWASANNTPSICNNVSGLTAYDGVNYACLSGDDMEDGCQNEAIFLNIPLCEGVKYRLKFYYNYFLSSGTGRIKIGYTKNLVNQPNIDLPNCFDNLVDQSYYLNNAPIIAGSEWHLINIVFTPPIGWGNNQLVIWVKPDEGANLSVAFDAFSLVCENTPLSPSINDNLISGCNYAFGGSATSTVPNVEATSWCWDFGDGTSGTGQFTSHNYVQPGTYNVCLTVTGNCGGCSKTVCKKIDCNTPEFSCPCSSPGSLNIDAGLGTLASAIPEFNNLSNGQLDLSQFGGCIAIAGNLIIDNQLFISNGEIKMQPCSEITVGVDAEASITSATIHGCETMWKGIKVLPRAELTFLSNTIEDAQFGITVFPDEVNSSLKPTVAVISRNLFNRNHVGVYFAGNLTSGPVLHMPFSANVFNNTSPLLPLCDQNINNYDPNFGYAGVVSQYVNIFSSEYNEFYTLRNGIIAEDCDFNVKNNRFEDLSGFPNTTTPSFSAGSTGIGVLAVRGSLDITKSTFNNLSHGIFSNDNKVTAKFNRTGVEGINTYLETHGSLGMIVEGSQNFQIKFRDFGISAHDISPIMSNGMLLGEYKMDNNYFFSSGNQQSISDKWGIELTNTIPTYLPKDAHLSTSYIRVYDQDGGIKINGINRLGIHYNEVGFLNPGQITTTGLELDNSTNCYLYSNTIGDAQDIPGGIGTTTGYSISSSPGNTYCCNTADGNNILAKFSGTCINTDFKHSNLGDGNYSILCDNATWLSPQSNKGNIFGINSGFAVHNGSFTDINQSEFHVPDPNNSMSPPDWPENLTTPDWFFPDGTTSGSCFMDAACVIPPYLPEIRGKNILGDTDIKLSVGNFSNTSFEETVLWEGQRDLYARLVQNQSLLSVNTSVDSFYHQSQNTAIGKFYFAESALNRLNNLEIQFEEQLTLNNQLIAAYQASIDSILQLLSTVNSAKDSSVLYHYSEDIWLQSDPLKKSRQYILEQWRLSRLNHAVEIYDIVDNLPEFNILQRNRKIVYKAWLDFLIEGRENFSSNLLTQIRSIADQCPSEGGTAVFMARSLASLYGRKYYNDNTACLSGHERSGDSSITNSSGFKIVPNPANDNLQVILNQHLTNFTGSIYISDVSGKKILDIPLTKNNYIVDVNVSSWNNGLYFLTIYYENQQPVTQKVIIFH